MGFWRKLFGIEKETPRVLVRDEFDLSTWNKTVIKAAKMRGLSEPAIRLLERQAELNEVEVRAWELKTDTLLKR